MDAKGYLYAAEMTDLLLTVLDNSDWDVVLMPQLGSPARLFAHLVRVRDVYRDSLQLGTVWFPGRQADKAQDLGQQLQRSRTDLARAIEHPKIDRIRWGDQWLTPADICATAIQHEGIHQGQWHVALKHAGRKIPMRWQTDWYLT